MPYLCEKICMLKHLAFAALFLCACTQNTPPTTPQVPPRVVGGDQDAHGCKGSAGYTWSVLKNECIRVFESGIRLNPKAAQLDQSLSAFVVFKTETDDAQAELYLPGQNQSLLLTKAPDNGAGTWKNEQYTLSQWKGMYTLQDAGQQVLYEGGATQ